MCEEHTCPKNLRSYRDLDPTLGQHPASSGDVQGFGLGLMTAFQQEPHLERAVRKLLLLDYDCFHDLDFSR
jgi:hypothetical protein